MNRKTALVGGASIVAMAAALAIWAATSTWWQVDRCLDRGGCWVYGEERCEWHDQAACDASKTQGDGPELDGQGGKPMEHALLISVPLSDNEFGSPEDRQAVFSLEDALIAAFSIDQTVEVDGHEFGDGKAVLFIYGRDADAMFSLATPVLQGHPAPRPIKVTRRYGPATDPTAKEVVSEL